MLPTRIWRWVWSWWWCAPPLPVTIFPMTVGHNSWPFALSLSGEINSSARQEVCRVLWDQKFHHRVHKSLPLDPYLNQIHRKSNFFKTHINIVLLSTPWSLKQPLSYENPPCSSVHFHACHMSHFIPSVPSDYFIYHFLNTQQFYVLPTQCIYVFCVDWEQTAIISLCSINWLVLITETDSVYCAVRTKYLNIRKIRKCNIVWLFLKIGSCVSVSHASTADHKTY